jgi:hypothetical protein
LASFFRFGGLPSEIKQMSKTYLSGKLTKDNPVAFLPHLGNDRLTWIHDACESDFDVLEFPEGLQDVFAGDAHCAQAVQDWFVKATDRSELGQDL